jgi:threonine/homoserine/homoserine lactone efflux protein
MAPLGWSCHGPGVDINWVAFVGVVALAYFIPGPDMAVILRSATRGSRAGAAAAIGAQLGLCVHLLLAVAGLSVVLTRSPEALTAIRIAGGLYLLYLGGRLILPTLRRPAHAQPAHEVDVSTRSAFGQGLFTNLLNPKAVLFFAAVLPQFLVPGAAPTWVQVVALGVLDIVLGFVAWAAVVALGVRLSSLLRRARVRVWWDRVTGATLGGIGGGLVVTR